MDDVADDDPLDMAPCAYCGVFRRDLLAKYADEYDADKLLTGHNLDDEAETALMNILEGNVTQIATHFDASLGSFDDRAELDAMIPRAKPSETSRKKRWRCTPSCGTSRAHGGMPTRQ